jgi:Ca2+-binding RTX toxin-like protein
MRGPRFIAVVLSVLLVPLALSVAEAGAAKVSYDLSCCLEEVIYRADPGETNDVTLARSGMTGDWTFSISDPGIPMAPGPDAPSETTLEHCVLATGLATCNGSAPAVRLNLGDHDDAVDGGTAGGTVNPGSGDDVLSAGLAGGLVMLWSPGSDELVGSGEADYSRSSTAVSVQLDDRANDGPAGEHDYVHREVPSVIGSLLGDTLTAFSGEQSLFGLGGYDTIRSGGGIDYIDGGAGADTIGAGAEADYVQGDSGGDDITGGPGRDDLNGDDGADVIHAADGARDSVSCGDGNDTAYVDPVETFVFPSCENVVVAS